MSLLDYLLDARMLGYLCLLSAAIGYILYAVRDRI